MAVEKIQILHGVNCGSGVCQPRLAARCLSEAEATIKYVMEQQPATKSLACG